MNPVSLKIVPLHPEAKMPAYGTEGAACFDFCGFFSEKVHLVDNHGESGMWLNPTEGVTMGTGLQVGVPKDWALMIYSRSGHGFKFDTRLANATGVIDSDYRGELMVRLKNDSQKPVWIAQGSRVAQGMLVYAPQITFEQVDTLDSTLRGTGGFGSTGT